MSQDTPTHAKPATEPSRPADADSPALNIYEHFMGLQRLKGWLRNN